MMQLKEFEEIRHESCYSENLFIIRCPFESCNTRIIPLSDTLKQSEINVKNKPEMVRISNNEASDYFLKVNDVWDFDNIGVSRPTDTLKEPIIEDSGEVLNFKIERLLVCSECDKGPIGFAGFQGNETDVKNLKYFLSCSSVLYEAKF